jgi:hypothetical protein
MSQSFRVLFSDPHPQRTEYDFSRMVADSMTVEATRTLDAGIKDTPGSVALRNLPIASKREVTFDRAPAYLFSRLRPFRSV